MRRAGHKEDMSLNQKLASPLNVHYIFYIVLSLPTATTHHRHPQPPPTTLLTPSPPLGARTTITTTLTARNTGEHGAAE